MKGKVRAALMALYRYLLFFLLMAFVKNVKKEEG